MGAPHFLATSCSSSVTTVCLFFIEGSAALESAPSEKIDTARRKE